MESLYHAMHVDPTVVTDAELAEIYAEFDLRTDEPGPADFFQPGVTYRRPRLGSVEVFSCAAIAWQWDGTPIALGYAPINLGALRTWEVVFTTEREWARGWTADPTLAPTPTPTEES